MSESTKDALQLLLDTGKAQQGIVENVMGDPFFITPSGIATGLKGFYPPRRIEQNVTLLDAGSFADYVNKFKTDATVLFAEVTETGATLQAVLDYHAGPNSPSYGRHVARFTTIETPEWKIWKAANRQVMNHCAVVGCAEVTGKLPVANNHRAGPRPGRTQSEAERDSRRDGNPN